MIRWGPSRPRVQQSGFGVTALVKICRLRATESRLNTSDWVDPEINCHASSCTAPAVMLDEAARMRHRYENLFWVHCSGGPLYFASGSLPTGHGVASAV